MVQEDHRYHIMLQLDHTVSAVNDPVEEGLTIFSGPCHFSPNRTSFLVVCFLQCVMYLASMLALFFSQPNRKFLALIPVHLGKYFHHRIC